MQVSKRYASCIAAATLFAAMQMLVPTAEVKAAESVSIAQSLQSLLYLPVYVAIDKGFFMKHGLNVTKITAGGSSNAVAAVISKSAAFSVNDPMTAAIASQKGVKIKVIGAVVDGVPTWIAVKKDSPIKTLADLAGKTISTGTPPSTGTYLLQGLLAKRGIKANLSYVTVDAVIAPLLAGKTDAAVLYEPSLEQAIAADCRILYQFSSPVRGGYAFSSIDVLEETMQKRPDMVRNFMAALDDAIRFIASDPNGTIEVGMAEFPSLPPDVVRASVRRMFREKIYPTSTTVSESSFNNALELPFQLGTIKAGSLKYADLVQTVPLAP